MNVLGSALGIASFLQERAGGGARRLFGGAGGDRSRLAVAADSGESDLSHDAFRVAVEPSVACFGGFHNPPCATQTGGFQVQVVGSWQVTPV